ncbi:sulfatase family protein [Flavicella marina]|uniref:sulfatase family protein n=1 Tax=Flavicella marina TaxID=1475951 RepID=UPI00126413E8|nr:arylsulfatase [Flavicella marina]
MTKNIILTLGVIIFCCKSFAQEKPNVIVVLADDIGVGDISHYRKMHTDKIILETPAIDALCESGMVFTKANAPAALCAPSRYAIITGSHCYRSPFPWGVWGAYQASPIKKDQLTLGKLMQQANYQTAFFGKWHLGGNYYEKGNPNKIYRGPRYKPETNVDIGKIIDGPQQKGFDYSFTLPAGIQASPYAVYENGTMYPLGNNSEVAYISQENMSKIDVKLDKLEGLGDSNWDPHNIGPLLIGKAVDYLEKNSKNKKPFFMYYCSQAVHKPHTPPAYLNGKKVAGTTPSKHLDMVKELDIQIEMLIETLKKENIYDNTLIVFTSDNGGLLIKETLDSGHRPSDMYRGGKNQCYEGGYKVPFIVSWPNKINANSISNKQILGLDIMATLAAVTGQEIEENQAQDSSNLLPLLLKNSKKEPHKTLLTQGGTGKEVIIIEGNWKLIIQIDKKDKTDTLRTPKALFDLSKNPSEKEKENLINSEKHQKIVEKLFEKYNETRNSKTPTRKL